MLELFFAYLAGLLTLINPCVLPVLPIVLASAVQGHRHGPLALTLGMGLSFVVFGMFVATLGRSIGLTPETLTTIAAVMMVAFGAVMLIPALSSRFEVATAGIAGSADSTMTTLNAPTLRSQFIGGTLLGAVWSPCIGPTLGGAIALASQGENLIRVFLIMVFFALGVSTIMLALAYGTREAIRTRQSALRALAERSKPILGTVFVAVGLMLYFRLHHVAEAWLIQVLPYWLQDLSVKY